jgi:hypothetical protein
MNREEFTAEILAALGNRHVDDETVKLTVDGADYHLAYNWIYRAERRIAALHDFEIMHDEDTTVVTVEDDDTPIDLPALTKSVDALRVIDGTSSYELIYKTPQYFQMHHPNPGGNASGKPLLYTIKARALRFVPVPDAIYTIYLDRTTWPTKMTVDASVSSFGEDYLDHVILEFAIAIGFAHFGEAYKKEADFHFGAGNQYLNEMIGADNYVPAHKLTWGRVNSHRRARRYYDLDAGSVPDGTVNPFR